MALNAKTVRAQLTMVRPLLSSLSLKSIRRAQNMIGELMEARNRKQVLVKEHCFGQFDGAWVIPRDERRQGVILYLHGGGYSCGDLEYALGFGSILAIQSGARVFCAAYRLAPEHPFPAALYDAFEAYNYLLNKGYSSSNILLCGESAGGGLCYALCLKLKEHHLSMPCGIIGISPWTDLTSSGESYQRNKNRDPSMTKEALEFFADNYTKDRKNPFVSPLFADLSNLPPSILFVGGDEIMLDDSVQMHQKLLAYGCQSQLHIATERWHGYLLYGLEEDQLDFLQLRQFLGKVMPDEKKLLWLPLDNAAKIYPAARRSSWSNVFRLSATLTEPVDTDILQSALDITIRRFPSIGVRLRRGVFWYYLQQLDHVPAVQKEFSYPLTRMTNYETRRCAFRVIAYDRRIAVELFHSLTDGTGGLIFLKSLVAEYLQQKYGIAIPSEEGILNRLDEPTKEELEDSFSKYAGTINLPRKEKTAWRLSGEIEKDGFQHVTCFEIPVRDILNMAHKEDISLTTFLAAAMMQALQLLQQEKVPQQKYRKPLKVLIPVNLRQIFHSQSLRNFALYTTPMIQPKLGEYSFKEICTTIKHHMGLEVNQKHMSMMIATNIKSERMMILRLAPLFLKNLVMKAVFDTVGERKSCLSLSNLGAIRLPAVMKEYVERMDFILGVQATAPYNCGVLSYNDTLYVNIIRNTKEPELERYFYQVLCDMGIPIQLSSNLSEKKGE